MLRKSVSLPLGLACAVFATSGCVPTEPRKDYGDPTALTLPTESAGIIAWVESPSGAATSADQEIVIAAYVAEAPQPLEVSMGRYELDDDGEPEPSGMQPAVAEGEPGPDQRFKGRVGLLHGSNRVFVRIATRDRTHVRTLTFPLVYEGAGPGATLAVAVPDTIPEQGSPDCTARTELAFPVTNRRAVCVYGRVSSGRGSSLNGTLTFVGAQGRFDVTPDAHGRYVTPVPLPPNTSSVLELTVDDGGETTVQRFGITQDETPPTIQLTSTTTETTAQELSIEGTAEDANGLAEVAIENQNGARQAIEATPAFAKTVPLAVGANAFSIVAVDLAGNEARQDVSITRVRVLRLGPVKDNTGTVDIELDRQALVDLLNEEDQKEIELVAIDLLPAVKQTLARIRNPEQFGVDTGAWGAPERNMQRILKMTPDVADLSGTSVEELLQIASGVGLPAPRLLADLLDMRVTDYILDLDIAAQVIVDQLVGTHPAIGHDENGTPVLSVSMYDVLQELATVAPRFGASGTHPGFLEGESRSVVLEPGFLLTFPVHSNLVQYDAVDLSRQAKDFLFLLEGERVLDFNVLTDDFAAVGLVDEPAMDLRFVMKEAPTMVVAGTDRMGRPDADDPGFYRGSGAGFALDPWLIEHIAVEIGYRQLHRAFEAESFQRVNRYDAGSIEDAATIAWDHGWVTISSAGDLGAPPAPLYAWDLLMEVAQVRLHDGVAEGAADLAFTLTDLPIGLTADELVEKLRPSLNEQQDKLSDILVGDRGLASSGADLFFVPSASGDGALLFRGADDAAGEAAYANPGFFSDASLTTKLSRTEAAFGVDDAVHEKVAASAGATYFAADETGDVFEIRVLERDAEGVGLQITKVVGGTP